MEAKISALAASFSEIGSPEATTPDGASRGLGGHSI
jgi:hypothetical protein